MVYPKKVGCEKCKYHAGYPSYYPFCTPIYYEKLRERLEKIIKDEEERRKENANYFNTSGYTQIYQEAEMKRKSTRN